MFKVTKQSNNRVDIEFDGALDADGMRTAIDDLLEKSQDIEDGRMLYKIGDIKVPTLGAFGVEFSKLPKLFSLLGKYNKCAVLSDAAWVRTAAEIEGAVIPGIEIKSFTPNEHDAAEEWLKI
ncbi:MAG: STAS/SEC14 domain-containing protein [Erythrobacter sp.]